MNLRYPVILVCLATVGVVMTLPASDTDFSPGFEQDGNEGVPKKADAYNSLGRYAYRLAFLPLRSMIYSYFRRLFRRFRRRRKNRGRSLNLSFEDREKCSVHHLGRWVDKENPCRFYECAMNITAIEKCLLRQNTFTNDENQIYSNTIAQHSNQIKRELVESKKSKSIQHSTFFPINDCVSLVRHQCKDSFIYSTLKQACVPINNVPQECIK